jgi:hypothetical protein
MQVQCFGAAGRVSGSCHLVQATLEALIYKELAAPVHVAIEGESFDLARPIPF